MDTIKSQNDTHEPEIPVALREHAYALADQQNAEELEILFRDTPALLTHGERRVLPQKRYDWQWLPLSWAIFADKEHYTPAAKECMRMLARVGYRPEGSFVERMMRHRHAEVVSDFFQSFPVDCSETLHDGHFNMLSYACSNLGALHGLANYRIVLDRASNIDARDETYRRTALWRLFTSTYGSARHELLPTILQAIDWTLAKGASPHLSAILNGWAHNKGEGEVLPMLHAVYWCEYTGRTCSELVRLAESLCMHDQRDEKGRTAAEYRQFLIDTNAPK